MRKILSITVILIIIASTASYANVQKPETIRLYEGNKSPDEVVTIIISQESFYSGMYIKELDGQKFDKKGIDYFPDNNTYLALPGKHEITVGYLEYAPGKNREGEHRELKTDIMAKPGYIYELSQNNRKYVSDPKEIRVNEYRPGEKYFEAYRIQIDNINKKIVELKRGKWENSELAKQYFELGWKYQQLKEYSNSKIAFGKGIESDPQQLALYAMLVPTLIEMKEYDEAIKTIKQLSRYEKRRWAVNGLYGEVYDAMAKYDKAVDYLKKAAEEAPIDHKDGLKERLGLLYSKMGLKEESRIMMLQAKEDKKDKENYYLKITEEMLDAKQKIQNDDKLGLKEKNGAIKVLHDKILKKYDINDDKLFEIITSTLHTHGEELSKKYPLQKDV